MSDGSMENERRLKRYRRKEYGELVGFPVEIVGRDGVVRRYDFEESVRLYERRMEAAPDRYADPDLVIAEQGHCRARIEQLRRSFFQLRGWSVEVGGPDASHPEHCGELAGFLARVFRVSGRLAIGFQHLGAVGGAVSGGADVWFLSRRGRGGGLLLYCYWPTTWAEPDGRQGMNSLLSALRGAGPAGDAERLVGWHAGFDCAFVLSARAQDVVDLVEVGPEEAEGGFEPTPWDEIADLMHKGDLPTALVRARWVVREQPWHRDAYVAGAVAALSLKRPEDAEDLAFVATAYLPEDGLIRLHLAQARLAQGRVDAAIVDLQRGLVTSPDLVAVRSLLVLLLMLSGRLPEAGRVMRAPSGADETADGVAHAAVVSAVVRAGWLSLAVMAAVAVSAVAATLTGPVGVLALALALTAGGTALRSVGAELHRLATRHGSDSVERAMARLLAATPQPVGGDAAARPAG